MAAELSVCCLPLIMTGINKEMRNRNGASVAPGAISDPERDKEFLDWQPRPMKMRPNGQRAPPLPGHREFSNSNSLRRGPAKDPWFGVKYNTAVESRRHLPEPQHRRVWKRRPEESHLCVKLLMWQPEKGLLAAHRPRATLTRRRSSAPPLSTFQRRVPESRKVPCSPEPSWLHVRLEKMEPEVPATHTHTGTSPLLQRPGKGSLVSRVKAGPGWICTHGPAGKGHYKSPLEKATKVRPLETVVGGSDCNQMLSTQKETREKVPSLK